ncbi:MAG TPA: glycosyltransferase family A protein [Thermoanaerobaculia bacterium]|nr:glycosyltransferase family A protein [Thermoanaerobaculia bacterium]
MIKRLAKPRVTAILPVFNGRAFVREAVQSVIAQTLRPVELIVVDDGSTDGSLDALETLTNVPFPIRILRQTNRGQSAARNLAAKQAEGEYLAFLDQDDRWYPQHLELLVAPLVDNMAAGWSYSDFDEMDHGGNVVTRSFLRTSGLRHPKNTIFECISGDVMVIPSASVLRRTAFEESGGFDETLSGYEDDDLFVRFFRLGWENVFVAMPLVRFRIHPNGSSGSRRFLESRMRYAAKLEAMLPDDPRMLRYYGADAIAPRFFFTTLDDYVRACSAREWDEARSILNVVNHFGQRRRPSLRRSWKLFWIQNPRVFRFLIAFNDRLPYRVRFIRNPTLRLR